MDFRRKIGRIKDDVEIGGRNCSLIDFLRHQEEIKAIGERHRVVHHRSARRIFRLFFPSGEEARVDSFANDHERNAGRVLARQNPIPSFGASRL